MAQADFIIGYIIAGGAARRMDGAPKGFLEVGSTPILARVIDCLRPQVARLVINSNLPTGRFEGYDVEVLPDLAPGEGPLGGLLTCLSHAAALSPAPHQILTVPWDCPFLPADLAQRLADAEAAAAIAESGGSAHPLTGLWSVSLLPDLRRAFEEEGLRAGRDWAARVDAAKVPFPAGPVDPFFNINTAEDLARAEELAVRYRL